ncbi:RNA polymerase sigma factor RpoD/SigA [Thermodesulfobacteriota bacterium]
MKNTDNSENDIIDELTGEELEVKDGNKKDKVELPVVYDNHPGDLDPYRYYINEIKKIPVLTREEEKELAVKYYKNADKDAAYTLIISNLRLVVKIAMEYHRKWIKNVSDMIQEGNIGLMEALKRYDPYKGVRFSSYSSYWVRAYIIKFIMDNYSLIKIGKTQAQRKLFFRLKKEKARLERLGYEVGPKLLAEKLQVREKDVKEMEIRLGSPILSLDEPVKDDSDTKHLDSMTYDEQPIDEKLADDQMKEMFKAKLRVFKESLNDNERFIFENRIYCEDALNLRQIGEALGFSRERARQIESKVLKRLKEFLSKHMPEGA